MKPNLATNAVYSKLLGTNIEVKRQNEYFYEVEAQVLDAKSRPPQARPLHTNVGENTRTNPNFLEIFEEFLS